MTECNAIIEANNEIDKLKKENKKLNELCVQYGFDMGRLAEENEQLKKDNKILLKHCEKHGIIVPMNYERYKEYMNDD